MTDIKQAVRELREATREHCPHQDRKGEHEAYTHETAEWYCRACGFVADWTVESRVVELRGALISQQSIKRAFTGRDANRADSYMGGVAERHLPAVLDRLEELEEALAEIRKIRSEAEPAEMAELRDLARMSGYLTDFGTHEKLRLLIKLAPYLLEASAERDAIRAKFAELRGRLETAAVEYDGEGETAAMLRAFCGRLLTRFPALDSSGDETEDGREG